MTTDFELMLLNAANKALTKEGFKAKDFTWVRRFGDTEGRYKCHCLYGNTSEKYLVTVCPFDEKVLVVEALDI